MPMIEVLWLIERSNDVFGLARMPSPKEGYPPMAKVRLDSMRAVCCNGHMPRRVDDEIVSRAPWATKMANTP